MSNTGAELPLLKLGDKYQIQTLNDVMLLKNASERTYQLSRFNDRQLDELSTRAVNELREYTRNALKTRDGRKPSEADIQEEILAMGAHYDKADPNDPLMNENISFMLIGFTKNVVRLRSERARGTGEVRGAAEKAVSGIKEDVQDKRAHSVSTQAPAPVVTSIPKPVVAPSAPVAMPKPVAESTPVTAPSAPVVVPKPVEKTAPVTAPAAPTPIVVPKPTEKPVPTAPSWKKVPETMPPLKAPSVLVTPSTAPKTPEAEPEPEVKRPEAKRTEAPAAPKTPKRVQVPDDLFGETPAVPSPAPAKKSEAAPEKAPAVPAPASKSAPAEKAAEPAKPAAPSPAAETQKAPAEKLVEPASDEKMRRKFFNALPSSLWTLRENVMSRVENSGISFAQTPEGQIRTVDLGSDPTSKARNLLSHGIRPDFPKYPQYREATTMFVATLKPVDGVNARELLIFVSNLGAANARITGIDIRSK